MSLMRTICPSRVMAIKFGLSEMMCPFPLECLRMPSRTSTERFNPCPSQLFDHADRLFDVVEAVGHQLGEDLFARMTERRVAEVVPHDDRLGERFIEAERAGHRAGDLRHLERMRDARAVVIPLGGEKDLRLAGQAPERLRVNDAIAIVLEDRADGIGRLGTIAPLAGPALLGKRREDLLLVVLQFFANAAHRPFFFGLPRGGLPRPPDFERSPWGEPEPDPGLPRRNPSRGRAGPFSPSPRLGGPPRRLSPRRGSRARCRATWSASAKSILRRTTLTDCTSTFTLSPSAKVFPERRPTKRQACSSKV